MIARMTRYDFVLLSSDREGFLDSLRGLGVVDIKRSSKPVDGKSLSILNDIECDREKIRTILSGTDDHLKGLEGRYEALLKESGDCRVWGEFNPADIRKLEEEAGVKLSFFQCTEKAYDASWEEEYAISRIHSDGRNVWFVAAGIPNDFPLKSIDAPRRTSTEIDAEADALRKEIAEYRTVLEGRRSEIPALESGIREKSDELNLYLASVTADEAADGALSVFEGFAPSSEDARLSEAFDAMDIYYSSEPASTEDCPPIEFRNNRFVRMFEPLTDMYGRPAYDGFDPTPFISIFFLLFFAMCMGDAGYGLILIIVGLLLKKVKSFASLAPLVVTLGVGTTVIGFLFHTFFSIDISQWECIKAAGLDRIMVPAKLATFDGTMVLALLIGIVHLCLAMIVKTVYATKNKGFLNSLGTWGWTLLIVGGVVVAAVSIAGVISATATKIIIIVLGSLSALGIFLLNDLHRNPLLNIGSGLWETYNTATGVLGDVLSYLRLYALGLAGGMLGFAFNDLAKMALGDGGFRWVPFILIVVVGHTLNLAMAALGAFVHPLRLNFLEFFKNSGYEATGAKYNPLKKQ